MAEGWAPPTNKVLCRYFINGACREGTSCHFSHDRQGAKPSMVCRYYLKGHCSFGQTCRFDHIRAERVEASRRANTDSNQNPSQSTTTTNNQRIDVQSSNMTVLKRTPSVNGSNALPKISSTLSVDAPEFVPKGAQNTSFINPGLSYAQILGPVSESDRQSMENRDMSDVLCPYYLMSGVCQIGPQCSYVHGQFCEMCQLGCLHPNDPVQREAHIKECTKLMEAEMEHSFGVAESKEKVCGICMDVIMDRAQPSQRRFGIMPNCNHCFCLDCLRKWRQSKQFENKIIRSCPECRTQSDYVIPSRYWVEDDKKTKLVDSYRVALSDKACKYFNEGKGECPFGNKCFYLHALPDGTKKDVGPPLRRRRVNAEGQLQLFVDSLVLWEFIEEREQRLELLRGSIQSLLMELDLDELSEELFLQNAFSERANI